MWTGLGPDHPKRLEPINGFNQGIAFGSAGSVSRSGSRMSMDFGSSHGINPFLPSSDRQDIPMIRGQNDHCLSHPWISDSQTGGPFDHRIVLSTPCRTGWFVSTHPVKRLPSSVVDVIGIYGVHVDQLIFAAIDGDHMIAVPKSL